MPHRPYAKHLGEILAEPWDWTECTTQTFAGSDVSPDTLETRVRVLERLIYQLEQRVNDMVEQLARQLTDVESDIRSFGPLLKDVTKLQEQLGFFRGGLDECQRGIRKIREDNENARLLEERYREQQRKERKADRRWLFGAALTAAGLVIAAIPILNGGFG